jgi:acyl-CoA thioesterase FadM
MPPSFPELEVDDSHRATAPLEVRYEDIAQDGRVKLNALPHAMGVACWRGLLANHPMSQLTKREGILPILSRWVIIGEGGPVSVFRKLEARGGWDVAHTVNEDGQVDRLIMILTTEVWGRIGRTYPPQPDDAGEATCVGRLYAEHVYTRPFGRREERKVRELPDGFGLPRIPERRIPWIDAASLVRLPRGVRPLEEGIGPDDAAICFGLGHTDSNQHVNSLVYPQIFEEAGLRKLRALGRGSDGPLPTAMEVAFRKPCFAGDRVRTSTQAFEDDGRDGIVAALHPEGGGSLHASGRIWF